LHNYIDIALTYERTTEAIAEEEGWSKTFGCVFHDHFVLAGPEYDPAGVLNCESLRQALLKIWALGSRGDDQIRWHARNDDSATMWKERSLWGSLGEDLKPWEDGKACGSWYQMSVCTPAEAIMKADAEGAYLITATLLKQTAERTIERTTVFFEPSAADDVLMNSCYALFSPDKSREGNEHIDAFLKYMVSERGQGIIERFGVEAGVPLFAGVKEGIAGRTLRGGISRVGKWIVN
jgi:tungstate transport system substrate-binding protein